MLPLWLSGMAYVRADPEKCTKNILRNSHRPHLDIQIICGSSSKTFVCGLLEDVKSVLPMVAASLSTPVPSDFIMWFHSVWSDVVTVSPTELSRCANARSWNLSYRALARVATKARKSRAAMFSGLWIRLLWCDHSVWRNMRHSMRVVPATLHISSSRLRSWCAASTRLAALRALRGARSYHQCKIDCNFQEDMRIALDRDAECLRRIVHTLRHTAFVPFWRIFEETLTSCHYGLS